MISDDDFLALVSKTPLISVDLILRSRDDNILLGRRNNRPAKGFWFVPGGRILKDERLADALVRVVRRELGAMVPVEGWRNMGIYEHLYPDNFAGADGISTHYVVLPHQLDLDSEVALESDDQHEALRWFSVDELMAHDEVHPYTKAYFARPAEPLDRLTDGL
ncbi:MAG: GDP-mannose mannosyl hydrolase [Methyloversatilis sp.]|uniref:GDP-mannose mannosyl hydrolase n=1 Tax=Methyloversatilis sp. TaxID=2569862 RepID=UPI0025E7C3D4|nr:GDP-mannose mannosyl hydrolase [Methyloversatilis sp.]MCR6666631.1 GDP-mannose mannosyl hydrolase [Methyloversatilis sp.]